MRYSALLASTAVACLFTAPATAQMQDKEKGPGAPSQMQREQGPAQGSPKGTQNTPDQQGTPKSTQQPGGKQAQPQPDAQRSQQKQAQPGGETPAPKGKDTQKSAEPKTDQGKKSAEPKTDPGMKSAEPKGEKGEKGKGTAQPGTPPDKGKGTAQGTPPEKFRDKDKGTAERPGTDKDGTRPKSAETPRAGEQGQRVQLSEQQRTSITETFQKDQRLNRARNVNFSISVGTRVPRDIRLAPVPAAVISLVPQYRSYRYVVVDEQICIVEPTTYEIVEVLPVSGRTAMGGGGRTGAALVLTEEEKAILLREVDFSNGSTLALGALSEGADIPRDAELREFSATVVQQVPKVKGYKFFTAENRLAIADPAGRKVALVIDDRR
jgi:hypothetical protein